MGLVFFLNLDYSRLFLQKTFFNLIYPLQKISYVTSEKIADTLSVFKNINHLKDENKRLYQENQQLKVARNQLANLKKENENLRRELGLLPKDKYVIENAAVIGKSKNTNDWIMIDKGAGQGIEKGMATIVAQGIFIGKVNEVFQNSSQVILVSNNSSGISVQDRETGAKGVARGAHGLGVYLDMVMPVEAIKENDEIITLAADKIPEGLLLGKLSNVHLSNDHLVQQADIIVPYDFSKIHFVGIIKK